jgi:large subunit ribosomal protein L2
MGKRLPQQRRGKNLPTFRAPSHRYAGSLSYAAPTAGLVKGTVIDLIHSVGHNVPLAMVKYEDGTEALLPASDGLLVGQIVFCGEGAETKQGNVMPLAGIPDGTPIFNIELRPGDGGKILHSSGCYAFIISKDSRGINVRLPSGTVRVFLPECRATIGIAAGGGRTLKPFAKAGKMHYKMHARNLRWPRSSASARNPVDHPFGGGGHTHLGKSQTVSHDTPPGRKVGSIAARSMGRGNAKRKERQLSSPTEHKQETA